MREVNLKRAKEAIQKIANREGVSVEHVRTHIKVAMLNGLCSNDPKVKSFWDSIPRKGDVPTPEEFISYTSEMIKKERLK